MTPTTRFLNVDLDLAGPVDLAPLLEALAGSTMVLRHEVGAERELARAGMGVAVTIYGAPRTEVRGSET